MADNYQKTVLPVTGLRIPAFSLIPRDAKCQTIEVIAYSGRSIIHVFQNMLIWEHFRSFGGMGLGAEF